MNETRRVGYELDPAAIACVTDQSPETPSLSFEAVEFLDCLM